MKQLKKKSLFFFFFLCVEGGREDWRKYRKDKTPFLGKISIEKTTRAWAVQTPGTRIAE